MQHYLCFLKSFPRFILTGGKIGVLSESSLIWASVTTSQRSAYKQKNGVHARAHLLCFHLSRLCFGFILSVGWETHRHKLFSWNTRILTFWIIKSEIHLWLCSVVLLKVISSQTDWVRAVFTLMSTYFFSLWEPRETRLLSSRRA